MSVNFTTVDTFKYWCNKILPLVYDDSLSYYEQLCKVVAVLNQVVENVNKLPEYIAEVVSDERLKEILTELLAEIKEQVASGNEGDSETATSDRVVGELVWLKGKLYRVIKQMDNGDRYVVDGNVEKVTVESVIGDLRGDVAEYVEVNQSIASKGIKEGELIWYKNELVKCIKDIAQGSGYVEGSNYEVVTVEKLLRDLGLRIDNEAEARKNADNTLQGGLYAEANNRESADNQLQSNIDTEKADRQSADNRLQSNIDTEKADRQSADNQLQSNIDTEKADRQSADNQLQSNIDTEKADRQSADKKLMPRKREMILIGDSYTGVIDSEHLNGKGWLPYVKETYGHLANFYNSQTPLGGVYGFVSSRPFLDVLKDTEQHIDDFSKITDIVVLGGTNDIPYESSVIEAGIKEFCEYCHANFQNAKIRIGYIGNHIADFKESKAYSKCVYYGAEYISSTRNLICDKQYISDGTHLTQAGYDFYNPYVAEAVMFGETDYSFIAGYGVTITSGAPTNLQSINFDITPHHISATLGGTTNPIYYNSNPSSGTEIGYMESLYHIGFNYIGFVFQEYSYEESSGYHPMGAQIIHIDPSGKLIVGNKTEHITPYPFNTSQCYQTRASE